MILKKIAANSLLFIAPFIWFGCQQEQEIPVDIQFEYSTYSHTIPAELNIENTTRGASFYQWSFPGGEPSSSSKKNPGKIIYQEAGQYTIHLKAWNDFTENEKTIVVTLDSSVVLNYNVHILINDFAPATIEVENLSIGGTSYQWTFEGGDPAFSDQKYPENILFETEGKHTVILEASNGGETFTLEKSFWLSPPLSPDFEIVPSPQDQDWEAPAIVSLNNLTESGLTYTWSTTGGSLANATATHTEIFFSTAGTYDITLTANNQKEVKTITKSVTILPNSNLYTFTDVKFGVSAAKNTVGSLFSSVGQMVYTTEQINENTGPQIDIGFYAINSSFNYCRFFSPDEATDFTFPEIPEARHTYIINSLVSSPTTITPEVFDAMVDDGPLEPLDISSHDSGTVFFDNTSTPHLILFETNDGRKGAIKITNFINDGSESYIEATIKIQKQN